MLVLDREKKMQLAMDRQRRNNDKRCSRIHDAKWRLMGIDTEALDKQVQEKKQREELERMNNRVHEKRMIEVFAKANEMQKEIDGAKRRQQREVMEYRCKYQSPHSRSSFDVDCDGKELGISAAQRFEGEDINYQERKRIQVEQNRAWLDQQVLEKKNMEEQMKHAHKHYLQATNCVADTLCEKMRNDICEKLKTEKQIQEYNKVLAQEKASRKLEEKKEMSKCDGFTMHSYYLGPVLTNDRPVPRGSTGNHIVASMYKGFTEADRVAFRKDLVTQIQETAVRKKEEAMKECEFEKNYENLFKEGLLREREAERIRKELVRQNMEENKKMAKEQKASKKEMNNQCKFQASDEFFNQFEVSP